MEFILAIVGMVVGAGITWWAAAHYYEKASRDLAEEAQELKKLNILMLRALEVAGLAEYSRDDDGNIKGMVLKGIGGLRAGPSKVSGEASVRPKSQR